MSYEDLAQLKGFLFGYITRKKLMKNVVEHKLITETSDMYAHPYMQEYIDREIKRPSKQWVGQVLQGLQESEFVQVRHEDFVLLPDTERTNKYGSSSPGLSNTNHHHHHHHKKDKSSSNQLYQHQQENKTITVNWLAIVTDSHIRTMRDLCGEHLEMLIVLRDTCLGKIQQVTGIPPDEVMVYLHYHPSVYHLHIHFAYPYMQYNHRDVYRIHSLNNVISNLYIDGDFYQKAVIQVSLAKDSALLKVYKQILGFDHLMVTLSKWSLRVKQMSKERKAKNDDILGNGLEF